MDQQLRPLRLTTPQYAVPCAVEAEPGMSNARLARAAFVTAQTMQGVLANLERDGLLARDPDSTHGRILRTRLTARGRQTVARAHRAVRPIGDVIVESFGEDRAAELAVALSRCADDLYQISTNRRS